MCAWAASGSICTAPWIGSGRPWISCSPPDATRQRRRFFAQAIDVHDAPEKVTIDKSGANTAAVQSLVADTGLDIELRQSKYLNSLVEQDHRAVKRRTRPMMGFGAFHTAARLIAGIEAMHAIKKGQLRSPRGLVVSDADRFYSLATR